MSVHDERDRRTNYTVVGIIAAIIASATRLWRPPQRPPTQPHEWQPGGWYDP